jgi:NCAIR mutase (PurE)-related protein
MQKDALIRFARMLLDGELGPSEFLQTLDAERSARLEQAELDLDRSRRCGYPEVIFGEGKTVAALIEIAERLLVEQMPVLITRVEATQATNVLAHFPAANYNATAATIRIHQMGDHPTGRVAIVSAGTSDLPVAEEARETLLWMNVQTTLIQDVGVAGPHRLSKHVSTLREADAVIVVAGMEGALPSVVGGHVACPVFAVPTSVGYGASFGGVAALLGMLNSCAANVAVVNIDAGFKAAYLAGLVAQRIAQATTGPSDSQAGTGTTLSNGMHK